MSFILPLPSFGEKAPRPESRQDVLDLFAELYAAVDNVGTAAEASHPGVTKESLHDTLESDKLADVIDLDSHRQRQSKFGRGTVVAAADTEIKATAQQQQRIIEARMLVDDARDHGGRMDYAS